MSWYNKTQQILYVNNEATSEGKGWQHSLGGVAGVTGRFLSCVVNTDGERRYHDRSGMFVSGPSGRCFIILRGQHSPSRCVFMVVLQVFCAPPE